MEKENETLAVTMDELENMDMATFAEEAAPEGAEKWRIKDDGSADWAIRKIADEKAEFERIKALADEQIARIIEKVEAAKRRYENGTSFLTSKLAEYFETIQPKESKNKTKLSYRLLSGTLVKKIGGTVMKQDSEKLLEYLKASGNADMIKLTEEPKWGEFKKRLEIVNDQIIDTETGELVEGVTIETKPDTFAVEI